MADGSLLVLTDDLRSETVEDLLVLIDQNTGDMFLDPGAGPSGSCTAHDWFHNNAMNWIIGDPTGWPEKYQKYFFKPVGDGEFDWQYEQHACVITPDGDVMCFDNGHWRSKVKKDYTLNKDNFSRGVRYKINTDDVTIEQVWQFGKERGQHFFSPCICNVEYYRCANHCR